LEEHTSKLYINQHSLFSKKNMTGLAIPARFLHLLTSLNWSSTAPHGKSGFRLAPGGVVGRETALSLFWGKAVFI
jgi:hypothetical protein